MVFPKHLKKTFVYPIGDSSNNRVTVAAAAAPNRLHTKYISRSLQAAKPMIAAPNAAAGLKNAPEMLPKAKVSAV
jgi:hypothetical protein